VNGTGLAHMDVRIDQAGKFEHQERPDEKLKAKNIIALSGMERNQEKRRSDGPSL
jgi:hypothetical protein